MTTPSLNEAQKRAVEYSGGHLLIVAGPGTGKTHTLTMRIARFLHEAQEKREHILAITFTKKAAEEMDQRLSLLNGQKERIHIATFHGFSAQILKTMDQRFADFHIAEGEAVNNIAGELWPDQSRKERKEKLERISRWKSMEFDKPAPPEVIAYNNRLRRDRLFDYDDLLLELYTQLNKDVGFLKSLQHQYPYIFVDEYQDINPIQHAVLKLLVGEKGHITAIGDPHQAIYGFRGSDIKYFDSFARDFHGAVRLHLTDNYRSSPNLLMASAQILEKAEGRFVPALTAKIYTEGHLYIHTAPTARAEAEYVVHQIEKLVGGTSMFSQDSGRVAASQTSDVTFGDIAVFYRLNVLRHELKRALERSGIPFAVGCEDDDEEICPRRQQEQRLEGEKVNLLSLHTSKGLEFPVVFIIGCEESILPLQRAGMPSAIQEERRLFYVGVTRAKQRLYLTHANKRIVFGKTLRLSASSFLSDIAEDLKKYEELEKREWKPREKQLSLFKE